MSNRVTDTAQRLLDVIVSSEGDAAEHLAAVLLVSAAIRETVARDQGLPATQKIILRARALYRCYGVILSNYKPDKDQSN